jgi:hypothetical protein
MTNRLCYRGVLYVEWVKYIVGFIERRLFSASFYPQERDSLLVGGTVSISNMPKGREVCITYSICTLIRYNNYIYLF